MSNDSNDLGFSEIFLADNEDKKDELIKKIDSYPFEEIKREQEENSTLERYMQHHERRNELGELCVKLSYIMCKKELEDPDYDDLNSEIWKTYVACINSFDPAVGDQFSHYYTHAIKRKKDEILRDKKNKLSTRGLANRAQIRNITRLRSYLSAHSKNIEDLYNKEELFAEYAGITQMSVNELKVALELSMIEVKAGDDVIGEDSEETYFDKIEDKAASAEAKIINEDIMTRLEELIDNCLKEHREAALAPVISAYYTNLLLSVVDLYDYETISKVAQHNFFNKEIYAEVLKERNGNPFSKKELAQKYGKSAPNLQQIIRRFEEKLRKKAGEQGLDMNFMEQ